MKIIQTGRFIEGEYVTISIEGNEAKRKVYYDAAAGDLFIWFKGGKYFYCEFSYDKEGDQE